MNKLKILVVDDESRMRKLVRDFLEKQNFAVLEAGDGSEALDIFFDNQDIAQTPDHDARKGIKKAQQCHRKSYIYSIHFFFLITNKHISLTFGLAR